MGIDNKYLIFKNIQPGLTVAEAATVDSVLLKLHSMGITFNLKADDWAVNVSANSLDLISQSSAVVEIVITRTVDLSDLEFETLSYLKIKNRFGQALYSEPTASTTDFKSFMIYNISSIGYYEFGFGMRKIDCYKFNSKNVLNNKIFPYDFVTNIDKDNLSATENINQDITLPDSVVIHKDYLERNVKYQTIPRYNIGSDKNKQSMKLSVFKENVTKDGVDNQNYIFQTPIHYGDFGDSANAKYWASYPEIYPSIIFNTTRSWDYERYSMQIESATNKIKITKESTSTSNYYDFNPTTDKLILYVRKPGVWEATNKFSGADDANAWKIEQQTGTLKLVEDLNTATLTLQSIKLYDISNLTKDTSWSLLSSLGTEQNKVDKNDIKYSIYNKVVKTPSKITMEFPSLNSAARKLEYLKSSSKYFCCELGEYDASGNLIQNPRFEMIPSIKGYQLVSYENNDSVSIGVIEESSNESSIEISFHREGVTCQSILYKAIRSNVGLLPWSMPYYGDCDYRHNTSPDGMSYYNLSVNKMDYEFIKHLFAYEFDVDNIFRLTIGYINEKYLDDAIAVVVWHNIKQEGE